MDDKADVSIPVEYTVGAAFSVRLPSSITLTNNAGSWDYSGTVGVKGDIDSGKIVKVTPAESITMYDVTNRQTDDVPSGADDQAYDHKDAKDATVAQTKQQWGMTELNADTYSDTDLTLTAGAMQSGKWRGMLPVNIWYGDELCINGTHHYQESITRAATCTEDGEKTLTCSSCGDVKTGPISATGHVDEDGDGHCDICDEEINYQSFTLTASNYEMAGIATDDNGKATGDVVIPATFEYDGTFYKTTSIGNDAFRSCTGLTSVTIPESVTSIGEYAFSGCTGLTSVTIPSSVTSIGKQAFRSCTGLTSVTIPEGVTSISSYVFYGCTGLTDITIPSSVTSIGTCAFTDCTGLTSVTIPESVTSIGEYAFSGCTGLTSVTIPSSLTSIESYAFRDCTGLTGVTIPEGVTSIGTYAFRNCTGLTSVTIPESVTSIGSDAFYNCDNLRSATFTTTTGWYVGSSAGAKTTALSDTDLAKPSTAASYLRFNYSFKYWTRE